MCRATDTFRRLVGICDYTPGPIPHARVRTPTRYGARGNGHAGYPSLPPAPDSLGDRLAREQRIIRQILADAARRPGGYG